MNIAYEDEILLLSSDRYKLIDQLQQLGEDDPLEKEINDKIDQLAKEIESLIKTNFEFISFELIMDELANLGQAPNLLYDDNGNWAVTSQGFQNVVYGDEPQDVETHFFVEAKFWKPTPREALKYYLNYEE